MWFVLVWVIFCVHAVKHVQSSCLACVIEPLMLWAKNCARAQDPSILNCIQLTCMGQ